MPFENKKLLEFLEEVDKILEKKIELIAVGGTAMTLLNLKSSTIDLDFEIKGKEYHSLQKVLKILNPGFKIDIFIDGLIFSQQLPEDFRKTTIPIHSTFKNIQLSALHPLDIVVTKIGRLNARDQEDIQTCIKKFKLTSKQIQKRAEKVEYTGNPEHYQYNIQYALKEFFKKKKSRW